MNLEKKIKKNIVFIEKEYAEYLDRFNTVFSSSLKSNITLIDTVSSYIVRNKGKQLRPLLLILSALSSGTVNENVYKGATVVELLHTATLIHDDVVDNADTRRSFTTIHKKWKNKIAILMGDYLLAKSLIIATEIQNLEIMNKIATVAKNMSQSEMFQIEKINKLSITEQEYFELIMGKTGSLISASCQIGGLIVGGSVETVDKLGRYGHYIGIAFQIKDDLLDYHGNKTILGKPVYGDLKEKKITLPLIYAFNKLSQKDISEIKKIMKRGVTAKEAKKVIAMVHECGGYEEAENKAKEFVNKAVEELKDLPNPEHAESLKTIAGFIVERDV